MVERAVLIGVTVALILLAGSLVGWWLSAIYLPSDSIEPSSGHVFPIPPTT